MLPHPQGRERSKSLKAEDRKNNERKVKKVIYMYVLALKNSIYVNDCDDGYHYNNPYTDVRDMYVYDYCEHVTKPSYAKKFKTKAAAIRFKNKLVGYMENPTESPYYNAEIVEIA